MSTTGRKRPPLEDKYHRCAKAVMRGIGVDKGWELQLRLPLFWSGWRAVAWFSRGMPRAKVVAEAKDVAFGYGVGDRSKWRVIKLKCR